MIDLTTLTTADIGRKVIYTSFRQREEGVLTSWNHRYVFVKFKGPQGEACEPSDVEFAVEAIDAVKEELR